MHFGIKDLIDVLLVAFFLYQTYKLMKSSGTLAIFSGVVSFIVVWILISQVLEMRLMGAILDKFISVGFVVLVILFQDEIRRFLLALGSPGLEIPRKTFFQTRRRSGERREVCRPCCLGLYEYGPEKDGCLDRDPARYGLDDL